MTFWGRYSGLAAVIVVTACLNDPAAPSVYRLEVRPDTIRFVALRDTTRPLILERHGSFGSSPLFFGSYAILDSSIATTSATGLVTSRGVGTTRLVVRSPHGASDTAVVLVTQKVANLHVVRDTVTLAALDALAPLGVVATDPLGSEIQGAAFAYTVADTVIAGVTALGEVRARANGVTTITASRDGQSAAVLVLVAQRVAQIETTADTIRFTALEQTVSLPAQPVDSLGHPVAGVGQIAVSDTGVLVVAAGSLRSKRNGSAHVHLQVGGLQSDQVAVVEQVPAQLIVAYSDTTTIHSVALDSLIPLSCRVLDGAGYDIAATPTVAPSATGHWSGSACDSLRVHSSGFDTLRISIDTLTATVPIALAVRPIVGPVAPIDIDYMPANVAVWAPSARRNSQGQFELYFAGYTTVVDSTGHQPGDLYRLISDDGQQFRYDGVVLTHDPDYCDPNGSGIENVAVVPRSDGPGWRMFYSGGSFDCYGWQVFSAVSTDERTWTTESGVRVSNGGSLPPAPPASAPWPAGEGMVTDLLPDGTWRMTMGSYEPLTPAENKFQITEWHSSDQLHWSYVRSLVTTRQLPPEGQRSAYSPTIAEIVPGLWRMIFTADNLGQPGGRSRLWSAVSTDRVHWSVEGEILGAPGVQYLYCALVDDRLYTLQAPQGPLVNTTTLATATVHMP